MPTAKHDAARRAVALVRDGMTVGLGSGSTAELAIEMLGQRIRTDGITIRAVATSNRSEALARAGGIEVMDLAGVEQLDLTIDGADEIDPDGRLIKGRGGALLREKIVACASRQLIIVADASKQVAHLGVAPLPIEVVRFAMPPVARWLHAQGVPTELRRDASGGAFVTDEGHLILDGRFGLMADPDAWAARLDRHVGVVEHGLFIGLSSMLIIGHAPG